MHPILAAAARDLKIELPCLSEAAARTYEFRDAARATIESFVGEHVPDRANEPLIAAFGSMAREEMSAGSDFDYLVILRQVESDPERIVRYRQAAVEALTAIGQAPPGTSGLFGVAISGADLVNTIGLETDSNLNLSRRVLLLEESVPLNADEAWPELVEAVAARYLHEYRRPGPKVPRFMLNDTVRYWRTVTVDYQAKRWQELTGVKWGLRYVKLITTRKLTFAGMVASLFTPVVFGVEATAQGLREQCTLPALARLAQLALHLGPEGRDACKRLLLSADRIVGLLNDPAFREAVEPVTDPHDVPEGSPMDDAIGISEDIQTALEDLFFSDEPLSGFPSESMGRLARRYLSF